MRTTVFCGLALLQLGISREAVADEVLAGPDCSAMQDAAEPKRYVREHQIPTTDRSNLPMITPGGMILELPKMVAATDVLTIFWRDEPALCFDLVTYARDRHRCRLMGIARLELEQTYVFRDDESVLRLSVQNPDHIEIEPLGKGYRSRCEALGVIEPATYQRAAEP